MQRQYQLFLLLVSFVGLISSVVKPTDSLARNQPYVATSDNGGIALPGSCTRVTPGNGDVPTCCVSGYVWMDGQIIRGATVTITAPNGRQQTLITDLLPDSDQPYYRAALTGEPLNVQVGQTITITARYSSHEQTVTYVVRSGGQQVDLVLAKNYAQDYVFDSRIPNEPLDPASRTMDRLAVDSQGYLYGTSTINNRVIKIRQDGTEVTQWGSYGALPGQFSQPNGIAIDEYDNVYVVDTGNHRIQKFSVNGTLITTWGGRGNGDGNFLFPSDVAIGPNNTVHVADAGNHRIQKFQSDGSFISKWGRYGSGSSYLNNPKSITVDRRGDVYVSDLQTNMIQKYSSSGQFLFKINDYDGSLFSFWVALYANPDNSIFVSVFGNKVIRKYNDQGQLIAELPSSPDTAVYLSDIVVVNNTIVASSLGGRSLIRVDSENRVDVTNYPFLYRPIDSTFRFEDSQETSFISHQGYKILTVSRTGQVLDVWTDDRFHYIEHVTRDERGYYYLVDHDYVADTSSILVYSPTKSYLFSFNSQGIGDQRPFYHPGNIVVKNGQIYVASSYNDDRIMIFDLNGQLIDVIHAFMDLIDVDSQGKIYAIDGFGDGLIVIDGDRQRTINAVSDGRRTIAFEELVDVFVDSRDQVYLTDKHANRFLVLDNNQQVVTIYGTGGIGDGVFTERIWMEGVEGTVDGVVAGKDKVYVIGSDGRFQALRPLTYTQPVATISWLSQRSIVQGNGMLEVMGTGYDSDEDSSPGTFVYRWYLNGTLLETGSTIRVSTASLPVGAHTLSLEVTDEEGEVSPRVSTSIDVSPPPQTGWTFMLYLVADSYPDGAELLDAMDTGFGQGLLARLRAQERITPNAAVDVVVQIDAYGQGNTRRLVLEDGGNWREIWRGERAMDDADTLTDFVRWGKEERPASHYYLAIASHGNGYQGVAWDDTSGAGSYLTMSEIGQALENASLNGASPLDVLHLDACSMGLLDVAYELRDNVRYLVMSQNLGWSFFLQDKYRMSTGANTTPRQLGQQIVSTYAGYAEQESNRIGSQEQYPYTISLLDLQRVGASVTALDALSRELGAFAEVSNANRYALALLRATSQKFDSPLFDFRLSEIDEYVDLINWAERLVDSPHVPSPAIKERARMLIASIKGSNPLVVAARDSGARFRMPSKYGSATIDLSGSNGVSLYYPHELSASVSTVIWYRYKNDQLFQFTADTQWNEFLRVGNGLLPAPTTPQPEPGKPAITLGAPWSRIFIPFAAR